MQVTETTRLLESHGFRHVAKTTQGERLFETPDGTETVTERQGCTLLAKTATDLRDSDVRILKAAGIIEKE